MQEDRVASRAIVQVQAHGAGALVIGLDPAALAALLSETGLQVSINLGSALLPIPADISPREQQILRLIADGRSNVEIAAELFLSLNTIKSHIRAAYRKIDVTTRAQAVRWAVANGLHEL